jgi:hypothetical protein
VLEFASTYSNDAITNIFEKEDLQTFSQKVLSGQILIEKDSKAGDSEYYGRILVVEALSNGSIVDNHTGYC